MTKQERIREFNEKWEEWGVGLDFWGVGLDKQKGELWLVFDCREDDMCFSLMTMDDLLKFVTEAKQIMEMEE